MNEPAYTPSDLRSDAFHRKYQAVLDFVERLEHFAQFQERLDVTSTLDQIWSRFLQELGKVMAVENCALYLVDADTHEFLIKDASPEKGRDICEQETARQIETGMFAWVINRRKPSILPSLAAGGGRTVVMLPLATYKQILGVVIGIMPLAETSVTHESLKLLEMLGRQCSLVIENATLYDNLRKEHDSLLEAQRRIVRAEKMASVAKLAAGASHEIMNPLNIISGHIQLLQMDKSIPAGIADQLDIMRQQARRIAGIVRSMGLFSRPSAPETGRVDMRDTVEKAVSLFSARLASMGVSVIKDFCDNPAEVCGDGKALQELIMHLISNAGSAMEPGGGVLGLSVGPVDGNVAGGSEWIKVVCTDTGRGIPQENLERIFDPFFTTSDTGNGPGLGLTLCHRIVEDHGGTIHVNNRNAGGSEFIVQLPAAESC